MAIIEKCTTKTDLISLTGTYLPIRFGKCRELNLREFLPEHLKESQVNNFIKVFEDYLNTMYSATCGYTISESDI